MAIFGSVHWLYIQADATGSWRSGLRAGVSKQVHHSSRAYSALPHQPCACHVGGGAARCKVGLVANIAGLLALVRAVGSQKLAKSPRGADLPVSTVFNFPELNFPELFQLFPSDDSSAWTLWLVHTAV